MSNERYLQMDDPFVDAEEGAQGEAEEEQFEDAVEEASGAKFLEASHAGRARL